MTEENANKSFAKIKVVGVGGGGGNAISHMAKESIKGVKFLAINTDLQHLEEIKPNVKNTIQIGGHSTRGLGAGADPEVGRKAAEDDAELIKQFLADTNMVFITAGMGGGTGTGGAPVVARIAKEMGILTVGVVTKPFPFEGAKRSNFAEKGIEELKQYVDSLIIIPNEKLQLVLGDNITVIEAFAAANDVLLNAVQGISEIITTTGMVNVDFADVYTVMKNGGSSMMGTGVADGEDRAKNATEAAIYSPLLDNVSLKNAKGILVNITTAHDLTMSELNLIGETIAEFAHEDSTIVCGNLNDNDMGGKLKVNIVATGLDEATEEPQLLPSQSILSNNGNNNSEERSFTKKEPRDSNSLPSFLRNKSH